MYDAFSGHCANNPVTIVFQASTGSKVPVQALRPQTPNLQMDL